MAEELQLAVRETTTELDRFARLGQWLAASESGSEHEKARGATAALRLFYAHELGLPAMAAAEVSVIKGRLFVQSKLLRALAARHGYRVERVDGEDACTAVLYKGTKKLGESTFTLEDARRANLVRPKGPWETHPARMLWARASKYVLDDYAPEVTTGIGTVDELDEIQSGEPRPVPPPPVPPPPPPRPDPDEPEPVDAVLMITAAQRRHMFALFGDLKITDRDEYIDTIRQITGRTVESSNDLTQAEAVLLIDTLRNWVEREDWLVGGPNAPGEPPLEPVTAAADPSIEWPDP